MFIYNCNIFFIEGYLTASSGYVKNLGPKAKQVTVPFAETPATRPCAPRGVFSGNKYNFN